MSRWLALLLVALCLAGCRAPRPSLDPFAAYGNQCVPAPATGTIGYGSGYYQAPVGQLYGPTARALQPVPTLGSAPTQQNWESASRPADNAGAVYQPPRFNSVAPANNQVPQSAARDENLVWIPPYAQQPSRVTTATATTTYPQYSAPPASLPPVLRTQPQVVSDRLLIPPVNVGPMPAPVEYISPVRPSFARPEVGYVAPIESAPYGSVVTYEAPTASSLPPVNYGPPIVAAQSGGYPSPNSYRVADDGWDVREKRR